MSPLDELRSIRDPLDKHLHELPGSSLKVLLYIWRRTAGWGKAVDMMTIRQISDGIVTRNGKRLDHGTGLSRRAIVNAIQDLGNRGLIAVDRREGKPSRYSLKGEQKVHGRGAQKGTGTSVEKCTHTVQGESQLNSGLSSWQKRALEQTR